MKVFKNLRSQKLPKFRSLRQFCDYSKVDEDTYFLNMANRITPDHLLKGISKNLEHTSNTVDYEVQEYDSIIENLGELGWSVINEEKYNNKTMIEKRFEAKTYDYQVKIVVWPQEQSSVFTDVYNKNDAKLQNYNLVKKERKQVKKDEYQEQLDLDIEKIIKDNTPDSEKNADSLSIETENLISQKIENLIHKRKFIQNRDDAEESMEYQPEDVYEKEKYTLKPFTKRSHMEDQIKNVYFFQIIIENLKPRKSKKTRKTISCAFFVIQVVMSWKAVSLYTKY